MGVSSRYPMNNKKKSPKSAATLQHELESNGKYKQALNKLSYEYKTYKPSSLGEGVNQSPADESLLPLTKLAELATIRSQKIVVTKSQKKGEKLPRIASVPPLKKPHNNTSIITPYHRSEAGC